jgi:tetratricopeptide (TPR) repeat protein
MLSMDELHRNTIAGAVPGHAVQARDVGTIVMAAPAPTHRRVPHQLPALGDRVWVNRVPELEALDRLVGQPGPTWAVLTGMGGVGKTALAGYWLLGRRSAYPDGELYCDLGGWSGRPSPAPEQVLAAWVRALGVPADDVPHELGELSALYRTVLADRSMLILADNAAAAEQVRPLLPGSSTSVLLVTSRHRLPELHVDGFAHVDLTCLSSQDATALLVELLPGHQIGQTDEVRALADRCHGLPLAVRIAGGHLTLRRHHSPARLLARLDADPRHGLDLGLGERSVGAVLDMSYDVLDPADAWLYRLCALHPGVEFTVSPLAVALGQSESDTEDALATLVDAHLVTEVSAGRYRLHDLVREHAEHQIERHDTGESDSALRLMIWWYLARTADADLALHPFGPRLAPVFQLITTSTFATPAAAVDWFEQERSTVVGSLQLAADHGWDEVVCQFAEALWNLLLPNYSAEDLLRTQQLGADAARRCQAADEPSAGDPGFRLVEAVCLMRTAFAQTNLRDYEAALRTATAAVHLATDLRHDRTRSAALSGRARAHLAAGNPDAALEDLYPSLELAQRLGNQRGMALRHRRLGQTLAHPAIADYTRAIEHFQQAATLMRSIGDDLGHARVIIHLADARVHAGQADTALAELEGVVDTVQAHRSPGYIADLCAALGTVHAHLGHTAEARHWYGHAFDLYERTGTGAVRQRDSVAALRDALPQPSTPSTANPPEDHMLEPVLTAIAAALARKATGSLYELVQRVFTGQPDAEAALATAAGAAPDSPEVHELGQILQRAAQADGEFAAQLQTAWEQTTVDQRADQGGVTNQITGGVFGNVAQARDVQEIKFGDSH